MIRYAQAAALTEISSRINVILQQKKIKAERIVVRGMIKYTSNWC